MLISALNNLEVVSQCLKATFLTAGIYAPSEVIRLHGHTYGGLSAETMPRSWKMRFLRKGA